MNVMWDAYKPLLDIVVAQHHLYCVCGSRYSSDRTFLEMRGYRSTSKASEDMGMEMELCEVVMYNDTLSRKPANELMNLWSKSAS